MKTLSIKKFIVPTILLFTGIFPISMSLSASNRAGVVYAEDLDGDGIDDEVNSDATTEVNSDDYTDNENSNDDYFDYTGDLDLYTGKPTAVEANKTSGIVTITDNEKYNLETHMFLFSVNGGTFGCSVADKMVTNSPVSIEREGEFNVAIYRNGTKLNGIPSTVSDAGNYTVITWDDNSESQLMTFQIVGSVTGTMDQYVLPEGFVASTVLVDGIEAPRSFGVIDMTEEGYYEIRYSCNATKITYDLAVSIDHIPPQITLQGLDKDNRARGPVTVQGLQKGDTVSATLDDEKVSMKDGNKFTESGQYTILVTDNAGNVTRKDFQILLYLNVKSVVFLIIFVVLVAGVFVALYITRKNLRVR